MDSLPDSSEFPQMGSDPRPVSSLADYPSTPDFLEQKLLSLEDMSKRILILLLATLPLLLVEMTVTVRAQERRHFTSSEFSRPERGLSIHEIARRYGVTEAVEFSHQLQEEEDARREMEQLMRAQRRDRELREKITELARTSIKLYQRFDNPSETHADTPQLAKKCEELAKAIKKLLR